MYTDPDRMKQPLVFEVTMLVGRPLVVRVTDEHGRSGESAGDVVEPARTRPVTAGDVIEHIGRLGGTRYSASDWRLELTEEAGIGLSALHRVRREALEAYERTVLKPWAERSTARADLPSLPPAMPRRSDEPALVAEVATPEAARACLAAGADEVHVTLWAQEDAEEGIVPMVPRVLHDCEAERHLDSARSAGMCVSANLGALLRLAEEGRDVQAHWSLNALNAFAVAQLAEMGASRVWLSPELSMRQIASIAEVSSAPIGLGVAGRQEIMVLEHCVLMAEGSCAQRCDACPRRRGPRFLKDRKGYTFPVLTDPEGRSHVYNSVPLDVTSSLAQLLDMPVAALRLDLHTESARQAASEVERVRAAMRSARAGRVVEKPRHATTSGHYFRGV
jgi:putative protease